jgi:hypothetical protein
LFQPTAGALAVQVPVVQFDENNATVLEIFGQHKELVSLPVVERQRPIGLISRHIFMSQMSKPYHRELYERKSCIAFMDKDPSSSKPIRPSKPWARWPWPRATRPWPMVS